MAELIPHSCRDWDVYIHGWDVVRKKGAIKVATASAVKLQIMLVLSGRKHPARAHKRDRWPGPAGTAVLIGQA